MNGVVEYKLNFLKFNQLMGSALILEHVPLFSSKGH